LITCSDSRIAPDLLMQAKPGDIFTLRNAGNIIPPHGASDGGEAESRIRGRRAKSASYRGHGPFASIPTGMNVRFDIDHLSCIDHAYPDLIAN
jgi:carbonic anhydrase-like protein